MTSPDGTAWTIRASGTTNALFSATYGLGAYVCVGDKGRIIYSTNDASAWYASGSPTTNALRGVAFGDAAFEGIVDAATRAIPTMRSTGASLWVITARS